MASPAPEIIGAKRKRSPMGGDDPVTRPAPIAHSRDVTKINYLVKMKSAPFRLIEGDSETFGDVLGMIDDYEGVYLIFFSSLLQYLQVTCIFQIYVTLQQLLIVAELCGELGLPVNHKYCTDLVRKFNTGAGS